MGKNKIIQFRKPDKKDKSRKGFSFFNEGMFFYNQDKDDLALEKFLQAERDGYESVDMFCCISWLYGEKKKWDIAEDYAKKALECDSEYGRPYVLLGNVYFSPGKKHDFEKALSSYLKADELGYNDSFTCYRIAVIYLSGLNYLKALEFTKKALEYNPNDIEALQTKADIYFSNEEYKKALKYYLKTETAGSKEFTMYYRISYCYSMINDLNKAIEYANKAIFKDKNHYLGYYRKGFAYFQAGEDGKAFESFVMADKLGCEEDDMYTRLAYLYLEYKSEVDKCLEMADKALSINKKNGFACFQKASVYYSYKKNYKLARQYFNKAYKSGECVNNCYFYNQICANFIALRQFKRALFFAEEGLTHFENDYELLNLKIFIHTSQKNYEKAKEVINLLLRLNPEDENANFHKVVNLYNLKKYDNSISKSLKCLEKGFEPQAGYFYVLALCFWKKKDYEKSAQYLYKIVQIPNFKEFYSENKKHSDKCLSELMKKMPDNKNLQFILDKFSQAVIST